MTSTSTARLTLDPFETRQARAPGDITEELAALDPQLDAEDDEEEGGTGYGAALHSLDEARLRRVQSSAAW